MDDRDDLNDRSISRRRLLQRIGVGAAVAWTVPIITSLPASGRNGLRGLL